MYGVLIHALTVAGLCLGDGMSLRSKVIRLAHENPNLRHHLLPLVTARMAAAPVKGQVTFEVKVRAAMRDYREDPESPVQTRDILPKPIAWARFTYNSAKEASTALAAIVKDLTTQWERGIGKGYSGAVDLYALKSKYTGGNQLDKVTPDHYRTAEISIDKVMASGDHRLVSTWSWTRGDSWKKTK